MNNKQPVDAGVMALLIFLMLVFVGSIAYISIHAINVENKSWENKKKQCIVNGNTWVSNSCIPGTPKH